MPLVLVPAVAEWINGGIEGADEADQTDSDDADEPEPTTVLAPSRDLGLLALGQR